MLINLRINITHIYVDITNMNLDIFINDFLRKEFIFSSTKEKIKLIIV